MVSITLTVDGQQFDVNLDNNLKLLGELIINEIKKQIRTMNLIVEGGGAYLQKWFSGVTSDGLKVESGVEYSTYLEFGTFALGGIFSETTFPTKATDSKAHKKKDLPPEIRKMLAKGMIPFAPVRRVLFNQVLMRRLVTEAFSI